MNSINIDGQVNWKTCVLIGVTIFLTHLLDWWYWTWQHIRTRYFFFWKTVFINRTWPFFTQAFLLGFILYFPFSSVMQGSFEIHKGCIILVRPFLHSISLKKKKNASNIFELNTIFGIFTLSKNNKTLPIHL